MSPTGARLLTSTATVAVCAAVVSGLAVGDGSGWIAAAGLVAVAVGWVITWRVPASYLGPALAWCSGAIALELLTERIVPAAQIGLWPVNLFGFLVTLLVFPDGMRAGRPWLAVPGLYAVGTAGLVVSNWGSEQVDGAIVGQQSPLQVTVGIVSTGVVTCCLLAAIASIVLRYRSGSTRQRQQIRWLLAAGIATVALLIGGWAALGLGAPIPFAFAPFLLSILLVVPIAIGTAVVRHDLFDIDRVMSESTGWFVTLVLSAGLFGMTVLLLSEVVSRYTGIVGAAAAFVTALALLPLHRWVNGFAGRLIDRDRYVAVATMERFAADVRAGRREPEEVELVLRQTQNDPDLRVLLARSGGRWVTMNGSPTHGEGFTLESGGDPIARVVLGWDSARSRRRIAELATVAWVPIEVSRLRLELRESLTETRASRSRLVEAAAQERRRLVRDLHDGAQQRLVATGLRLRLMQHDPGGPSTAEIDIAIAELRATVDELRRLANGVRPSQLDDGLEAALVAIRDSTPIPLMLHIDQLPVLEDTRAFTAYLVVSEAVTNVLKHARASRIDVWVSGAQGRLAIRVTDDGIGGLAIDAALPALRDRVLSVGGDLAVLSGRDAGTTITATL